MNEQLIRAVCELGMLKGGGLAATAELIDQPVKFVQDCFAAVNLPKEILKNDSLTLHELFVLAEIQLKGFTVKVIANA